ncbi:MAG: SUMF1/EgtB/PvdO family nonheme iron enzyme [Leptolyngbyaceae cyanobacterium MO_188.B28]|nr:SUMF1/EgtB/PvdO family nonheme iron enzyme [Leptolyngbyaceae cyanobacterium MO_188.B28]
MGKYALLIGVGEYGESLENLNASPKDAEALAEVLQNPKMGGFEVETLLNPNRNDLAVRLEVWFADRKADDTCVVFFSGHGLKDDRRDLYFAARDTRKKKGSLLTSTAVAARNIYNWMNRCKAKRQVMILDCCFSGAFGDVIPKDDGMVDLQGQLIAQAEGRVVLTSTNSVDYSFEQKDSELSVYTRYLTEGIRTGAADLDGDRKISVDELHRYAKDKVQESAPAMEPKIISLKEGEGYRIVLAQTPVDDKALIYRKEVEAQVKRRRGKISPTVRRGFKRRQAQLGLSPEEAKQIETEVCQPYEEFREKLTEFEQAVKEALEFDPERGTETIEDLRYLLQVLKLRDQDVQDILKKHKLLFPPLPDETRGEKVSPPTPSPSPSPTDSTFEYEVVTVDGKGKVTDRQTKQAEYQTEVLLGKGVSLELVMIPGGRFQMGSPEGKGYGDERPQHSVTVKSFWMGKHPVTQAQWKAVAALPKVERDLDSDPSNFKGDDRPAEQVSWYDAVEFCQRLSQRTGQEYRLPSEAEWEYACRAGTTTPFHFGPTLTTDLANYDGNYSYDSGPKGEYRKQTTPVGSFKIANAFGLYDMHGNVWEWCLDHWHENYQDAPSDGSAWETEGDDSYRSRRGSSWYNTPVNCRSAHRGRRGPDIRYNSIGLRVVRVSARTSS